MMEIYFGNLTIDQIEKRLGVELSEEHRAILKETHQDKVNNTPIEHGKWHCFDLPFMLMTHDKESAEKFRDLFMAYDATRFKEQFQIGWES